MEPHEAAQEIAPSHAGIPPLNPAIKTQLLALLDQLIAANAGKLFFKIALSIVKGVVESLPTA